MPLPSSGPVANSDENEDLSEPTGEVLECQERCGPDPRHVVVFGMRPHILLVDDDEHLRTVIGQGLERRFNVTLAGTAEEALRAAAESSLPIDVIVMDIMLPDSWGSQVAMEQQLFLPDAKVIFISGYAADDEILKASIGHGDAPFLPKPFTTQVLGELIDKVLEEG